jgi:hypothetical protein
MSTLKSINIIHPSGSTNNIVNDSSGNVTIGNNLTVTGSISGNPTVSGTLVMGSSFMRNRIINGAMVIDQRYAGASVNSTAIALYTLDRWIADASQANKFSIQQNAGSVTPPTGFSNYLGVTSLSAYSLSAADYFVIDQKIEGYNVSDFAFGNSNAKTITLSFWVRSSLTGSFGGNISNGAYNRSYSFSYTISAANTWEHKSVTIPGDVTGTWITGNGNGLWLRFSLGSGSTFSGTANTWQNGVFVQPTGSQSVVGTNGATWYVTGVQLEVGSVATPFEREIYSATLAKCQRYYYRVSPGVNSVNCLGVGYADTTVAAQVKTIFPVTMRTAPTALEQSGTAANYALRIQGAAAVTCSAVPSFSSASVTETDYTFTVASGLTAGGGVFGRTGPSSGTSAYLGWSAEL